jgi:DNA-3-methyladenine glycosylase II
MIRTFSSANFHDCCNQLAKKEPVFRTVIQHYGYPPLWRRTQSFASLIHIILEQQVSLASAKAAFEKLKAKIGFITAAKLLLLSDKELKNCYFSRQKIVYARELAQAIITKQLVLRKLASLPDDEVRKTLVQVKGIGNWTVDVYLLFALQRADVFPIGDLAMVNALKEIKKLLPTASKEEMLAVAENWRPYRSVATMLLWHYYIKKRNIVI